GNITETVNSLGAVGRYTWTAEGDPLSRSLPDGLSESWEWDAERNLLSHTSTAGQVTRFEYGPFALPVARTDPDGASYRFEYTSQLQLRTVHTAHGQTWDYEYDSTGNLIAEADFNGTRQFYMFDPAHQVTGRSNEAGQETFYGRDVLGRLTERVSGTDRYRYSYNGLGQLEHAEGPGVVMDYARDGVGRIVSETVNGRLLATSFDANGRVVARTTPTGAISEWERDAAGRVVRMRSGADELEFSYDTEGNEISRKLGGSAVLTQSFDTLGRLTAQHIWSLDSRVQGAGNPSANSRRALQSRTYAYGRSGFPERVTDQLRGDHGFTLDQAGRVLRVQGATWHEAYAYDALGNVIEANVPSPDRDGETSGLREFDGSRLRRNGRTLYEYDQAGRLVRKRRRTLSGQTKTWKFEWSADDNLVTVETPANGVWRYSYDPLGRRVAKRHESGDSAGNRGPEETWFTWDGQLVAEQARVSAGGQVKALTWDYRPGTYRPVAQVSRTLSDAAGQREIDREFFAIVTDMVGVPQELIAPNGEISWSTARTTIWGEVNHGGDSGIECPLAFPGQYHDDETGLNYNLNRFYDPETAAYLTPDPLGLAGSENPHRYVTNPVAWIDPLGLKKVYVNDGGRFGDFNPGEKGDGLTPHHMPQDALHFLPRDEGGAIVMSHEDHKLTRTYGARGGVTAKSDKGLPFRDVLQKDLRDVRGIGESQHGDRKYFEPGIKKVLKHYEDKGLLTKQDVKDLSCPYS
ncbi:MAG: hypothetical protein FWE35_10240, partial [Streptosporangiales bacterium]|nr:hypothetical protein [Streptosporangiales bacterium]